jgi:UDP-glucose 4-epimerase
MILVERKEQRSERQRGYIVALFGNGLIGRSILAAISKAGIDRISELSFSWTLEHRQARELEAVQQDIFSSRTDDATSSISGVDIIWAAGRSGFGSSEDQVMPEVRTFEKALAFSHQLLRRIPDARHAFHLISSAGGLFEGQKHVDRTSLPHPLNPYSRAKLQQEQMLSRLPAQVRKTIYRLSTVYGFSGKGVRFGLVNTLIQNSIRRQPSHIFGNALTIRDYVLVSDVGKFVANRLQDIDARSRILTLASGKPTTIFEMLNRIENIIGRKCFYSFDNVSTNTTDISFSPAILPEFWFPTDLDTGLRQTARQLTAPSLALDLNRARA